MVDVVLEEVLRMLQACQVAGGLLTIVVGVRQCMVGGTGRSKLLQPGAPTQMVIRKTDML